MGLSLKLELKANNYVLVTNSVTLEQIEQCVDSDFNILLKSQKSYNRTLIALEYADYCLEHDYRYNCEKYIEQNIICSSNRQDLSKEQEIVALKEENKALRKKIAELEAKYIDSPSVFSKANCIVGEIVS